MRVSIATIDVLAVFAIAVFSPAALGADKITLTSGEVVEGRIVSETDTAVRIEVPMNASGSIFKSRTVPREEIQSIDRQSAAETLESDMEKAYKKTQRFRLQNSSIYEVSYYTETIEGVFSNFVTTYPDSPYVKDVEAKIARWQAERQLVAAGNVKHKNKWITGREAALLVALKATDDAVKEGEKQLAANDFSGAIARGKTLSSETTQLVKRCAGTPHHAKSRDLRIAGYDLWHRALKGKDRQIRNDIIMNNKQVLLTERRSAAAKRKRDILAQRKDRHSESTRRKMNALTQTMAKERKAGIAYRREGVALKGEQIRLKARIQEVETAYEALKHER